MRFLKAAARGALRLLNPEKPVLWKEGLPYRISIGAWDGQHNSDSAKTESFDSKESLEINAARLMHLDWMNLDLGNRSVLDVGCGVGHLAQFFVKKGCRVVCVDGREANISTLRGKYPGLEATVLNVETTELVTLGKFDIVFCYGLLYHLENPFHAIRNMAMACNEVILLETIVCDHYLPLLLMENESSAYNQALWGSGCRPTPSYVALTLNRAGFPYVYAPTQLPDHSNFRFEWKNNMEAARNGGPIRCIFVASRKPLDNPTLISLL